FWTAWRWIDSSPRSARRASCCDLQATAPARGDKLGSSAEWRGICAMTPRIQKKVRQPRSREPLHGERKGNGRASRGDSAVSLELDRRGKDGDQSNRDAGFGDRSGERNPWWIEGQRHGVARQAIPRTAFTATERVREGMKWQGYEIPVEGTGRDQR